jgi:DNA replication protein DnaD
MNVSLNQSELLTLQTKIIIWLQQQILLQPHPTTIETENIMKLLGQAIQYHATMIDLEERLHKSSIIPEQKQESNGIQVSSSEPIAKQKQTIASEVDKTILFQEDKKENNYSEATKEQKYFSLSNAHKQAVEAGCTLKERAFRDRLIKGETLFGWRKEDGLGISKPCYSRV